MKARDKERRATIRLKEGDSVPEGYNTESRNVGNDAMKEKSQLSPIKVMLTPLLQVFS
jgi:hypothetical protein